MSTDRVMRFARNHFESDMEDLLDDPSTLLAPYRERSPQVEIGELRALAADMGLDYDELVGRLGTDFERERLRKIEAGEIEPAAQSR
jgi:hypothetical protein